jgi:16S rRNA (uracil1498-N3)-methyltransferase
MSILSMPVVSASLSPAVPPGYSHRAMNMLILEEGERLLPPQDPRARHILKILKKGPGDTLLAGIAGGEAGLARVISVGPEGISLDFEASGSPAPLHPLTLVLGFPRPIQLGRILKDLTSLGAGKIVLAHTELGEKSYVQSSFLKEGGIRPSLIEGAAQAASPLLPRVTWAWSLGAALDDVESGAGLASGGAGPGPQCYALDNKEPSLTLSAAPIKRGGPLFLAVGSERGWSDAERALLRERGYALASLGQRVLKTETAALVAAAVALEKAGLI